MGCRSGSLRDLVEGQGRWYYVRACQLGAEAPRRGARSHALAIVHRDVKPPSLLTRKGRLKVADFGLARVEDPSELTNFWPSRSARAVRRPRDPPGPSRPRQVRPVQPRRHDVVLLTGKPPFEAARAEELPHKQHLGAAAEPEKAASRPAGRGWCGRSTPRWQGPASARHRRAVRQRLARALDPGGREHGHRMASSASWSAWRRWRPRRSGRCRNKRRCPGSNSSRSPPAARGSGSSGSRPWRGGNCGGRRGA